LPPFDYQGHAFLESARKDTIWQKAKEMAMKQTGGLSILALTEALKAVIKLAIQPKS
jgi:DNA polymerase III delta subunit